MAHQTKIATCCYCASRSILKPSARAGHELACGSCGAPLHNMKWLKAPAVEKPAAKPKAKPKTAKFAPIKPTKSKKPKKRRKPIWKRGLEEAWDILEDIFD